MSVKSSISFLVDLIKSNKLVLILIYLTPFILWNCAQFVPPTGGKKDEIPPKLLKSNPENEKLNFKGNELELFFDELIDVTSLRQELLVVPELEGTYDIKPRANSVMLKFDKPFKEKTTYTFNFRNGIKDLTERNEAKNLKLVFSTGNEIDSLQIEGNIKSLFTNQPILEAMVAIYVANDSLNLKKTKPSYFTKTDSSGNFKFENIKSANYRIYSFTDKNNNLRFDAKTELIGFMTDTLKLLKNISSINLSLYQANNEKPKNQKTLQRAEDFTIIYDKNIKIFEVNFENIKDSIPFSGERNELKFYNFPTKSDTIKAKIIVKDSAENTFTHLQKIKFREPERRKKEKREYLSIEVKPKLGEDVDKMLKYQFNFEVPIAEFDFNKFRILSDTIKYEPLSEKNIEWNAFKTELNIKKETTAKREIRIDIEKGAFINIKGDSSNKIVLRNQILKAENYGIIEGKIEGGKENKIIQLIDENYKVEAEQIIVDKFYFKNIKPGIYLIRTIIDSNTNNQWDFGNIEKNILPEKVYFSDEPIRIKANFEIKDLIINLK